MSRAAARSVPLPVWQRKSSRSRSADDDPDCLLAGGFLRPVRRSHPESHAMSWRCWVYNPSVAGSIGRGTGNLTGSEQVVIRRVSGRNRSRAGGEARAQDQARPGCKARPGFPSPARGRACPRAQTGRTPGGRPVSAFGCGRRVTRPRIILLQGRAAATGGRQGRRCSRLRPGSMTAGSNLTGSARLA